MKYFNQVLKVTLWEFTRFFKPKNEAIGIIVMIIIYMIFYFGSKLVFNDKEEKLNVYLLNNSDTSLVSFIKEKHNVNFINSENTNEFIKQLNDDQKDVVLLTSKDSTYLINAYQSTNQVNRLKKDLNIFHKSKKIELFDLNENDLNYILSPAPIQSTFVFVSNSKQRTILAYVFAGLMILAIFLSFAYQFTAITGEKQLKITELIVSAIKPQIWMDGKIFGITLTGIVSMITYSLLGIIGTMLFFQFRDIPNKVLLDFLHLPSILLYIPFVLLGILIWNAILAAIASIITDPNNSSKSSIMLLPVVFVVISFAVIRDPDSSFSIFLSWFPLTSASAMPMRWAITDVDYWQLIGSFLTLTITFYYLRKLASKIFRVAILISGKEPSFKEIYKLSKM